MKDIITKARELCEKATPGEWEWHNIREESDYYLSATSLCTKDDIVINAEDIYPGYPECGQDLVLNLSKGDADFIVRSRTLIPELCNALEKAKAEIERLERVKKDVDILDSRVYAQMKLFERAMNGTGVCGEVLTGTGLCAPVYTGTAPPREEE